MRLTLSLMGAAAAVVCALLGALAGTAAATVYGGKPTLRAIPAAVSGGL